LALNISRDNVSEVTDMKDKKDVNEMRETFKKGW